MTAVLRVAVANAPLTAQLLSVCALRRTFHLCPGGYITRLTADACVRGLRMVCYISAGGAELIDVQPAPGLSLEIGGCPGAQVHPVNQIPNLRLGIRIFYVLMYCVWRECGFYAIK